MNLCVFCGDVVSIKLQNDESTNFVNRILLEVKVENRRKSKIDTEILLFEAWDSAANTINDYCEIGDVVLLKCHAKKDIFRINEFQILQNVQDFEYED